MMPSQDSIDNILKPFIQPWYDSLDDPAKAQEKVLADLLLKYGATDYGKKYQASKLRSITDYQVNFPIINYSGLVPYFKQVKEASYASFLSEPPECWVMTRGSTGSSKVLPATQTHLKQIFSCGARAIINYAIRKQSYDVFLGVILNLNFPSSVQTMTYDGKEVTYGYSSGTYARLNPMFDRVSLLPRQEEIDALAAEFAEVIGKNALNSFIKWQKIKTLRLQWV